MPTDIAIHPIGDLIQGIMPPAPSVPVIAEQTGLAEATNSNAFVVPAGRSPAAVMVLISTVKLRVDFALNGAALDATTSGVVLIADQPRIFALTAGSWVIKTAVYA